MDSIINDGIFPIRDYTLKINEYRDSDFGKIDSAKLSINLGNNTMQSDDAQMLIEKDPHTIIEMDTFANESPNHKTQQLVIELFFSLDTKISTLDEIIKDFYDFSSDSASLIQQYDTMVNTIKIDIQKGYNMLKTMDKKDPLYVNIYKNLLFRLTKYTERINEFNEKFMKLKDSFSTKKHSRTHSDGSGYKSKKTIFDDDNNYVSESQFQAQMQVQSQAQQNEFIEYRNQEIGNVMKTITELYQMMTELQILVEEQGEILEAVDSNLTTTLERVIEGRREIKTGNEYQKKSSKCCIGLGCALIIFIIIISILIIIVTLNKNYDSSNSGTNIPP